MKIIKVNNYDELSEKAAEIIAEAVKKNPSTTLGLATGSSPLGTYNKLIDMCKFGKVDFSKVHTVNLDEYVGLEPTHDQSYRYFMNTNLFDHINIDKNNTFVPSGIAPDMEAECKRYDGVIEKNSPISVQLLGIGENGHIGFNEPADYFPEGTHVVDLTDSTIEANKRFFGSKDEVPKKAITMGLGSIMKAETALLIACGKQKVHAIDMLVNGKVDPKCPASILQNHKNAIIIVDNDAAAKI